MYNVLDALQGPDRQGSMGQLHLKVLDLSSNILHTLHQDLFEFLSDLEELNLASNPFKMLDHATLVALSSIHKIQVRDIRFLYIFCYIGQYLKWSW